MKNNNIKYLSITFALLFLWACSSSSTDTATPNVTVTIANTEAVKGTDLTLVALVANNTNQVVTWSVVSTTPAGDNTVTIADGKLKTTAATTATTVKIKAISKADTSKSVMKDITISSPVTAIAITSEGPATKGTDYTLTATVSVVAGITPAPVKTVTWILVSTTPPDDTTVTIADGKLKTTAATTATTAKVKAMSNADNAQIIMTDITINASAPALTGIAVTRTDAETGNVMVTTGGTLDLVATFTVSPTPSNAALGTLTWTVATKTGGSTATATVDGTTLTAGATAGDVTVTVTSGTGDTAKNATIDITISATTPALTGIAVARADEQTGNVSVMVSGTLSLATTFTVTPTPAGASVGTLTWAAASATGSTATATVDGTTLTAGATAGDVTLTVTSGTGDTAKTATIDVTISTTAPTLASIAVARTDEETGNVMVTTGGTLDLATTFAVTPTPTGADVGALVWTAAPKAGGSTATATVDGTTLTAGATAGDVTLTVTSGTGDTAKTATIDITIGTSAISVTISGPTTIEKGGEINLTAEVTGGTDNTVVWRTEPASVSGVSLSSGQLTINPTLATGSAITIVATHTANGQEYRNTHIVKVIPALRITSAATAAIGTNLALTAFVDTAAATTGLVWTIKDTPPAGVSINNNMLVTTTGTTQVGTVTVIATYTVPDTDPVLTNTKEQEITLQAPVPDLVSIAVARADEQTENISVMVSATLNLATTFAVTPTPTGADVGTLVWTAAPKAGGSTATATVDGTTLTAGATAGDVTLTVTSGTGGTAKTATIDVTISTTAPTLASIAVARTDGETGNVMVATSATLNLATTFRVSPIPSNAALGTWTWTVATKAGGSTATATVNDSTLTAGATAGDVTVTVSTGTGDTAKTATIDVTITASTSAAPVQRADANYQGMIVGSTGHFYVKTTEAEKKMTVVLDDETMNLNHVAAESTAIMHVFKTTDNMNTMSINVPTSGTPSVETVSLQGHTGAVAEVTAVDHGTQTAETEKPLIFEGYQTFYAVKRNNPETAFVPTASPTQAQIDAKIKLYRNHYNVVVKGGANAKLVVMNNFVTTEAEKATLRANWSTANIDYDFPFEAITTENRHASKTEYTIQSRTDSQIVVQFTPTGGSEQTITFALTTEGGKLKLTIPLAKSTTPELITYKDAEQVSMLKPLHIEFRKESDSTQKYYRFSTQEKFNAFYTAVTTAAAAYLGQPNPALTDTAYNAVITLLGQSTSGATLVATEAEAYQMGYPQYDVFGYSESVLTEIH